MDQQDKRIIYLDYLRVFSVFAMITLHVAASNWYSQNPNSYNWQVFNFYDSIVRWCVPVFVMISGTLFLEYKDYTLKYLFENKIFRLITAFAFWSFIYAFAYCDSIKQFVKQFIVGHYHMWFIIMIIKIYILFPIIKQLVSNKNIMKYFVILSVICLIGTDIFSIINTFCYGVVKNIASTINKTLNFDILFSVKYVLYFVLGYYIQKLDITINKYIYICVCVD